MTRCYFNNARAATIRQFICAAYFSFMLLFGTTVPASELIYNFLGGRAAGVSADGTKIVGSGGSPPPDGFSQAFIADISIMDSDGDGPTTWPPFACESPLANRNRRRIQ